MVETITLREIFQTLKKRIILILSITFLTAASSGVLSYYYITPVYESSTQLLINQENSEPLFGVGEIQTNLQLINTYKVLIKNPAILALVKDELSLDQMSISTLNSKITVSSGDSQVMTITVQDPNQYMARDIANSTASIFKSEITELMNISNVNILFKATASKGQLPVKPHSLLNIAIGMVVGLMLGIGLAFLLRFLDNTIKTEEDIEKLLSLKVLASISSMEKEEKKNTRKGFK